MKILLLLLLVAFVSSNNFFFNNNLNKLNNDLQNLNESNQNSTRNNIWAVLVAGSRTYSNYRHQADVCSAYQLIHKKHGIPKENIIVMMYDDIAYNTLNPYKGNIINKPDGENVYEGVVIDYSKDEVNSTNFIKVLLGNKELEKKGKKVLKSTKNDNVFVYFSDHGAFGMVLFPTSVLHSYRLVKVLNRMKKKKMFKNLLFYLEACESGSMFQNFLKSNGNIFSITAADSHESSFSCYYDKNRKTFLADLFTSNWIDDSSSGEIENETIYSQFKKVQSLTNSSHVSMFGNLNLAKFHYVSEFQGSHKKSEPSSPNNQNKFDSVVPSYDVPLKLLEFSLASENTTEIERKQYLKEIQLIKDGREYMHNTMKKLSKKIANILKIDFDKIFYHKCSYISEYFCYEKLTKHFNDNCFKFHQHSYALRYLYVFVNSCENLKKSNFSQELQTLEKFLNEDCQKINNHSFSRIE